MQVRKIFIILVLFSIIFLCKSFLFQTYSSRQTLAISNLASLPPSVAKMAVLEFPGIFADYLFLSTLTFMGDRILAKESLTPEELNKVYNALVLITDLDPWANDPYVLAETTLPWEANMVAETNQLLLKSMRANPNNYRTYLFLWFNYFHFLEDPDKAGYYLEKAARIPGVPQYYATLAARMRLFAGKLEQGILFLDELIRETSDPHQRDFLLLRQDALKRMAFLENKVRTYKRLKGVLPNKLSDLIDAGLLSKIPSDPYGGEFYLLDNGRVNTTSNLVQMKRLPSDTKNEK